MAELNTPENDSSSDSSEALITTEQAAIQNLTARISQVETQSLKYGNQIRQVRTEINRVVLGVVLIFLFTVGAVAVEVIIFHTREDGSLTEFQKEYYREIASQKERQGKLESLITGLRDSLEINQKIRGKLVMEVEDLKKKVKKLSKK